MVASVDHDDVEVGLECLRHPPPTQPVVAESVSQHDRRLFTATRAVVVNASVPSLDVALGPTTFPNGRHTVSSLPFGVGQAESSANKGAGVDETALRNPQAVVDITRGAFAAGMRDFHVQPSTATSSCVSPATTSSAQATLRQSPPTAALVTAATYLAAGSENAYHLTQRAVAPPPRPALRGSPADPGRSQR